MLADRRRARPGATAPPHHHRAFQCRQHQLGEMCRALRSGYLAAALGVVVLGVGFLVLAATGMGGFPFGHVTSFGGLPLTPGLGFVLVAAGAVLTRAGGSRVRPSQPHQLAGTA